MNASAPTTTEDRIVKAIYDLCERDKTPSVPADSVAIEAGLQSALVYRTLNKMRKGDDARVRFTPGSRWKLTRIERERELERRNGPSAPATAIEATVEPEVEPEHEERSSTMPAPPPDEPPTPEAPVQLKPLALTRDASMLPCPFCGSSEISINGDMDPDPDGAREVQCGYCPGIVWGINEQEAIAAWNHRPAVSPIPAAAWSPSESTAASDLSELRSCIHQFGVWPDLRQKEERDYAGCVRHMSELISTEIRRREAVSAELDDALANEHRREDETLGEFIERIIDERDFPEHGERRVGERTSEFLDRLVRERADALKVSEERLMSTNGIIDQLRKERDEARANYQLMVDRVADEKLDGYRALGARAAAAEEERDEARRELGAAIELARQLQADIEAERAGKMELRRTFNAREDETFGQFVERLIHERAVAHDDLRQTAAELIKMRGKVRELRELGAELGAVENEPVAVFMRRLKSERDAAVEVSEERLLRIRKLRELSVELGAEENESVSSFLKRLKGDLDAIVERAKVVVLERDAAQLALEHLRSGWVAALTTAGVRVVDTTRATLRNLLG